MSIAKKAGFGVLGALVLGGLIFGKNMFSYTSTAVNQVRDAAEDSLSPKFQLDTARTMLDSELKPEISRMKTVVASARVDVRELTAKLEERASQVADDRGAIMARTKQLKSPITTFTIDNNEDVDRRSTSSSHYKASGSICIRTILKALILKLIKCT